MTGHELLDKLTQAGCQIRLDGDTIRVSGPLTDELRALIRKHKQSLISELQRREAGDPFDEMFRKAIGAISKKYQEGTMEHIRLHHPELYDEINQAESQVNTTWEQGLAGKTTLAEFREVLAKYYKLNLRAADLVRTDGFSGVVRQVFSEPPATDPGPALATGAKNNQQGQLF